METDGLKNRACQEGKGRSGWTLAKEGDSQFGKGGEVKAAPRLFADVEALSKMTQFAASPRVV